MKQLALVLALVLVLPAAAEEVDNQMFQAWKDFKAGTVVVHTMTTTTGMNGTRTQTLVSVSDSEVVIKTEQVVQVAGREIKQPATTQTYKAKMEVDPAKKKEMEATKKEGNEKITVGGKEYDCKWISFSTKTAAGQTDIKTWTSSKVPGGQVKVVSTTKGSMSMSMTMTLKSFTTK